MTSKPPPTTTDPTFGVAINEPPVRDDIPPKPADDSVPSLRVRTQRVISVRDWDHIIQSTYGRPYSFQQQDDCKG